jgi:hypothetical protein
MKNLSILKIPLFTAVILAFCFSLLTPTLVLAEGEVPESTPSPTSEPTPLATEEPTYEGTGETNTTSETVTPVATEFSSNTTETEIIIIDEFGNPQPLASEAALGALEDPDPYFYVAGVKYEFSALDCDPSENVSACDNPIQAAIDYLSTHGFTPDDKKIYIEAGSYDTSISSVLGITIDGSTWITSAPSLLIISGTGSSNDPAVSTVVKGVIIIQNIKNFILSGVYLDGSLNFTNNTGNLTIQNVAVTDEDETDANGIEINNQIGSVNLTDVTVSNSNVIGADINTSGTVTVKGSTFTNNTGMGLNIVTPQNISMDHVTVTGNAGNYGISLVNTSGSGKITITNTLGNSDINSNTSAVGLYIRTNGSISIKGVSSTLNNIGADIKNDTANGTVIITSSSFSNNSGSGMIVISKNTITLNNVTADANLGGNGITLENLSGLGAVQILNSAGVNSTTGNSIGNGLVITTNGGITLRGLTANSNGTGGVILTNNTGTSSVLISDSQFNLNGGTGLKILTKGFVKAENIAANNNQAAGDGLNLDNSESMNSIAIVNSDFNGNLGSGMYIHSHGTISLNRIGASKNTIYGAFLDNDITLIKSVLLASTTGDNTFIENGDTGLHILSRGAISINGIIATGNANLFVSAGNDDPNNNTKGGVIIDNTTGNGSVTITGANISQNDTESTLGLLIRTNGTITLTKVTANSNAWGADINNLSSESTSIGIRINQSIFNNNVLFGLAATSYGVITVNNLTAIGNQGDLAVRLSNVPGTTVGVSMLNTLGENLFLYNAGDALEINSGGAITINEITAAYNGARGVNLPNGIIGTGNVRVINSFFDHNGDTGLIIQSSGAITLTDVSASNNNGTDNTNGAYLSGGSYAVSIIRGQFNQNSGTGLIINATGKIFINSILANGNAYNPTLNADPALAGVMSGAYLLNNCTDCTTGITILSSYYASQFNQNTNINTIDTTTTIPSGVGLFTSTYGPLIIQGISASGNGKVGAYLINSDSDQNNVTITNSSFESNRLAGLWVQTLGNIILTNVTAGSTDLQTGQLYAADTYPNIATLFESGKKGTGAYLINLLDFTGTKNITILNSRFNDNYGVGLWGFSNGIIRVVNITAENNTSNAVADPYGVYLSNINSPSQISAGISITGNYKANRFSNNSLATGLTIQTTGVLTLTNIIADENGINGIYYVNASNTNQVNLRNIQANGNSEMGIYIVGKGYIYADRLTANHNGITLNDEDFTQTYFNSAAAVYLSNSSNTTGLKTILVYRSQFMDNYTTGLRVYSTGNITINGILANGNRTADVTPNVSLRVDGVYLQNTKDSSGAWNTSLSNIFVLSTLGANRFDNNRDYGLHAFARKNITISSATAIGNGVLDPIAARSGMNLYVTSPTSVIKINCSSVTGNGYHGIWFDYLGTYSTAKLIIYKSFIKNNSVVTTGEDIYINTSAGYSTPIITQYPGYCSGW